jgi:prefoldin subunit 5
MGIAERLNTEFPDVASFATAASQGVQEELAPLRSQISDLETRINELNATILSITSQTKSKEV